MSFLSKFESVMLKIFQIIDKLDKLSKQMTEPGLSDHDRKKTKVKYKRKSKVGGDPPPKILKILETTPRERGSTPLKF